LIPGAICSSLRPSGRSNAADQSTRQLEGLVSVTLIVARKFCSGIGPSTSEYERRHASSSRDSSFSTIFTGPIARVRTAPMP
jgi:hypothetical protein